MTAFVVAGVVGSSFAGVANAAAPTTTTITGTVKTSLGAAVSGVKVSVVVGAQAAVVATTSATGAFSMTVRTGSATAQLTSTTANASLPQTWDIKGVATTIATSAVLNFSLPPTFAVTVHAQQGGVGVAGAAISQCDPALTQADTAVVLTGTAAVAPTQDFTGSTTNATGDVVLRSFKDATLGRLCARYQTTVAGAVTTYAARSGMINATADTGKTIFVPVVATQAGTIKDSTNAAKAGLNVAVRSASGQADSTSPVTTAAGAFTTQSAAGDVFVRISGSSLSSTVAPPTNIPRAFKATFDATSAGTPWNVLLPATVPLTVHVQNADGTPVTGAVIRPVVGSSYGAANPATLLAGASAATLTQQVYGDAKSDAAGLTTARLFADSSLASFRVLKNVGGGNIRQFVVPAGTVLTAAKTITVTLPAA